MHMDRDPHSQPETGRYAGIVAMARQALGDFGGGLAPGHLSCEPCLKRGLVSGAVAAVGLADGGRPKREHLGGAQGTRSLLGTRKSAIVTSHMPTGNLHEQTFNVQLAEVLRDTSARWCEDEDMVRPERRYKGKQIDIQIAHPRPRPLAIEVAYGGWGDKDAKARLGDDIDTAIAVVAPPAFKSMSESAAKLAFKAGAAPLRYAVPQTDYRFPNKGYIEGTATGLAAVIPVAAVTPERLATLADEVAGRIEAAGVKLETAIPLELAKVLVADVYQRSTLTGLQHGATSMGGRHAGAGASAHGQSAHTASACARRGQPAPAGERLEDAKDAVRKCFALMQLARRLEAKRVLIFADWDAAGAWNHAAGDEAA